MKTITYSLVLYLIISSCLSLIYSRKVSKKIKTHKEPQTPMIREENFHSFIANFAHSYIVSIQGIASKRPFAKQIIHGKKDLPQIRTEANELLSYFSTLKFTKQNLEIPYINPDTSRCDGDENICMDLFLEQQERIISKIKCLKREADHAPEDNKKISELLNTMRHQYDKKVNYHNSKLSMWESVQRKIGGIGNDYSKYQTIIDEVKKMDLTKLIALTKDLEKNFNIVETISYRFNLKNKETFADSIQKEFGNMVPDQYFDIITQIYYAANSKGVDDVGRFFGRLYGSLAQILLFPRI